MVTAKRHVPRPARRSLGPAHCWGKINRQSIRTKLWINCACLISDPSHYSWDGRRMVITQPEARSDLRGLAQDLSWLDAILSEAVALQRARAGEMLPGVYISEGEVDELLGRPPLSSTVENGVVAPPE